MAAYRVLDIETVPDLRYWTPPPAKWRQEPVDLGHREDLRQGAPTLWYPEEQFPPPQAHRVVAMAWVELSGDDDKWYTFERFHVDCVWGYGNEADAVERRLLEKFKEAQEGDDATLVTWNGRTFDLPVINMRSFKHGISCAWYYKERDLRYRYTEACHCDLMDVFSDYGAARSMKLGDVAKLMGLPGKVGEVSGGKVSEIYNAHEHHAIAGHEKKEAMRKVGAYCLSDAMQTAMLFARSRAHKGMVSEEYWTNTIAPSFVDPFEQVMRAVAR